MLRRLSLAAIILACLLWSISGFAQAQSLSDDFNDNSLDSSLWTLYSPVPPSHTSVAEQNQRLEIIYSSYSEYNGIVGPSVALTDSHTQIQLVQQSAHSSTDTYFYVRTGTTDSDAIILRVYSGQIKCYQQINSTSQGTITTIAYNAAQHKFFRIRHRSLTGLVYWEVSADAQSWTILRTAAPIISLTEVHPTLLSGSYGNGNKTIFDNFHFAPNDADSNYLPTVSLDGPANNAAFLVGSSITLNASSSDSDGTISQVEFYQGSTKLGEDTTAPYSFAWDNAPVGNYVLTARAIDDMGAASTSTPVNIRVVATQGQLMSDEFDIGPGLDTKWLRVNWTQLSAFNVNSTHAGELHTVAVPASGNKWKAILQSIPAGDFTAETRLKITATDVEYFDCGLILSDSATTNAGNQMSVEVTRSWFGWGLTSFYMKQFYSYQTTYAQTIISRPTGYVRLRVRRDVAGYYLRYSLDDGVTWSSEQTINAGFTPTYIGLLTGNNQTGSTTVEADFDYFRLTLNTPPTVSITSPTNNSSFAAGNPITINADAGDSDGTVSRVEFFVGSTKLGEDTTAPYSFTWNPDLIGGSYALTARAIDDIDGTSTSSPINFTINPTPEVQPLSDNFNDNIRDTAKWNYGSIIGQIYSGAGAQDFSVPALEQNQRLEITPRASVTGDHWNGYVSASAWDLTGARVSVEVPQITASAVIDFAICVDPQNWYVISATGTTLNFEKAIATARSSTSVTYNAAQHRFWSLRHEQASDQIIFETSPDGVTWTVRRSVPRELPLGAMKVELGAGTWVSVATPGKAIYDNFRLTLNTPPTVSLTAPADNTSSAAGAPITISATASDSDGTVSKVEFFQGATKLGEDTTAPYGWTWSDAVTGTYTLTARAIDDTGRVSTSSPLNITVHTLLSGKVTKSDGGAAIAGATIKVRQGTTEIGTVVTNGTGDYSLSGLPTGNYTVEALAAGYLAKIQNGIAVTATASPVVNFSLGSSNASAITYNYDELGRLINVIDPAGDAVTYNYDAVGNLQSITRQSSTQTSVVKISPSSGPVGTTVVISGTGFSNTPGQNTVTLNGVAATVSSSSTTQIIASVPSGATTGPISITTPAGSASSSAPFNVTTGSSGAPTITGFTPTVGSFGQAVTISGTGFETTAVTDNKVKFNGNGSGISSATATAITTSFPWVPGAGRISITTPSGMAVSLGDFFVPPATFTLVTPNETFTAASVEVTGRMAIGETKGVTITTPGKLALIAFDGVAGRQVRLHLSGTSYTTGDRMYVAIYNPDGTYLESPKVVTSTSYYFNIDTLPVTGTYTIFINPYSDLHDQGTAIITTLHLDLVQ